VVGFDNFKCIPCDHIAHNSQPNFVYFTRCQNIEGLVINKCSRMCSMMKVYGRGENRTPPHMNSIRWLKFDTWCCTLLKDKNWGLGGFNSNHFKGCVNN
jgi:hypothetical protein